MTLPSRSLQKGDRLWNEGDAAATVAVVEAGKLGVWAESRLIGLALPGMVVGEAALLGLLGQPVVRTASVFALEDGTTVGEYPPATIQDMFGTGIPRLILRMLCGQICRNVLLALAANAAGPVVETPLRALIKGMHDCERETRSVRDWDRFLVAFQTLYHLRDASDAIRAAVYTEGSDEQCTATILTASKALKVMFKASDFEPLVEEFLEGERLRRTASGFQPA